MRRLVTIAALCIVAVCATAYAQAKLAQRIFQVQWSDGRPTVSFSAIDLADDKVRSKLSGGLKKNIVVRVQAYVHGNNALIRSREFNCAVTYDLWDDGYIVKLGRRTEKLRSEDAVIKRCLQVEDLIVGDAKAFKRHKGREIYFAVRAEFNPISTKRCRELLRSGPGDDPVGPIVVNIVRRRVCGAESTLEFRSQTLVVPE